MIGAAKQTSISCPNQPLMYKKDISDGFCAGHDILFGLGITLGHVYEVEVAHEAQQAHTAGA